MVLRVNGKEKGYGEEGETVCSDGDDSSSNRAEIEVKIKGKKVTGGKWKEKGLGRRRGDS